jgi:hypothetical protein
MSKEEAGIDGVLKELEEAFYYTETHYRLQQSASSSAATATVAAAHHDHGQLGNATISRGKLPQGECICYGQY